MRSRPLFLITASGVAALALAGCTTPAETGASRDIVIAVAGIPADFNTAQSLTLFGTPNQAAYESLLFRDEDTGEIQPLLATEYEISEDRMTISLTLREDVDFSDGEHLDAAAVEEFLDFAVANEGKWWAYDPESPFMGGIEATATGEYTLEITTKAPIGFDFFTQFTGTGIASPAALDDPEALAASPVGTGPYLLEDSVPDVSLTFVRNPDYWNPDAIDFDSIEFRVFDDRVAALNALKSGQIDAAQIDLGAVTEAENADLAIHTGSGSYFALAIWDRGGVLNPALADIRVRQAMNFAIDGQAILDSIYFGLGRTSNQPFSPTQNHYVEGGDDRYAFDPDRARELLAEAGYPDGLDLTIQTGPDGAALEPVVQQMLGDVGVRVTFDRKADGGAAYESVLAGGAAVSLVGGIYVNTLTTMSARQFPLYNGGGLGFVDEEFEDLLDVFRNGSEAESEEAAAEVGEYTLDQAWFVPLAHPSTVWATTSDITMSPGNLLGFVAQLAKFRLVD